MSDVIDVEVVYALPNKQHIARLTVALGTTAREAVDLADMPARFEGLVIDDKTKLGVFGKAVPQSRVLEAGDRVEIYRPLIADPKEARRARAQRAKEAREEGAD